MLFYIAFTFFKCMRCHFGLE